MKPTALIILLLTASQTVFAQSAPSCISTLTDPELLNEVARRMGKIATDGALVSISCRGKKLYVSSVVAKTGAEKTEELNSTDSAACNAVEKTVTAKIVNKPLVNSVMIASCDKRTLTRLSLHPSGTVTRLEEQELNDSASCDRSRDQINSAI